MANQLDVSQFVAFIFDLDGVIWRGSSPIEGAVEAIARLRGAGKRCVFCTNNSSSTPAEYVEKLGGMGILAEEDDILTSGVATSLYLESQLTGQFSAYVVGEEGLVSTLRKTGARVVTMQGMNPITNDIIEDTAFPVDCVIVGLDRAFNYDKLRLAQRFINNGARFIATNRDATFPVPDGIVPGAGAIVAAIETASGVSPLTIGKPQALLPLLLMQKFNLKPETTVFVGDRIDTDMVSAHRANLKAILVTTGISSAEDAERAKGQQKPDAVFASLLEMTQGLAVDNGDTVSTEKLPTMETTETSAAADTAPPLADTFDVHAPKNVAPVKYSNGSAPDKRDNLVLETTPPENVTSEFTLPDALSLDTDNSTNTTSGDVAPLEAVTPVAQLPISQTSIVAQTSIIDETPIGEASAASGDEAGSIEVDPAPSPFAFSLGDEGGASESRPAPHLASPSLTSAKSSQDSAPAAAKADGEAAPLKPGASNKAIDVSAPIENWWESIEDAFKK